MEYRLNSYSCMLCGIPSDGCPVVPPFRHRAQRHRPGPAEGLQAGPPPQHDAGAPEREGSHHAARPAERAGLQHLQQHHDNR